VRELVCEGDLLVWELCWCGSLLASELFAGKPAPTTHTNCSRASPLPHPSSHNSHAWLHLMIEVGNQFGWQIELVTQCLQVGPLGRMIHIDGDP